MARVWLKPLLRRLASPAFAPAAVLPLQHRRQKLAGIAARRLDDVFRRTPGDDFAAAVAAFGAEVDHPVRGFYHLEIVLDDDDRVALRYQLVQHFQQFLDVVEMQS